MISCVAIVVVFFVSHFVPCPRPSGLQITCTWPRFFPFSWLYVNYLPNTGHHSVPYRRTSPLRTTILLNIFFLPFLSFVSKQSYYPCVHHISKLLLLRFESFLILPQQLKPVQKPNSAILKTIKILAPKLRGIKQKKLIIHPSSSMRFLLFYSPRPRSQVRILIGPFQVIKSPNPRENYGSV